MPVTPRTYVPLVAALLTLGLPAAGGACSSTPTSAGSCAGIGGTIQECKQNWTPAQCANYQMLQWNGSSWVHDAKSCAERGYAVLCANPGGDTYATSASNCEAGPAKDAGGGSDTGSGSCDEGWYRCDADDTTILQCVGGSWTVAGACTCSATVSGRQYPSNCKASLSTTGGVDCSYAGSRCMECLPGQSCRLL